MSKINPKFIFTADDYGPVQFINQGVLNQVKNGTINSVQVLSNFDEAKLKSSIRDLWHAVPDGKILDVGVHVTITSGKPIYRGDSNPNSEKETKKVWGGFVLNTVFQGPRDFHFRKYTNFYYTGFVHLEKDIYKKSIRKEFNLQIARLKKVIDEVNIEKNANKLELTSITNHHNVIKLHRDLFEIYCEVANQNNLVSRSPKLMPDFARTTYFARLTRLKLNKTNKPLLRDARKLVKELADNQYTSSNLEIKSPAYFDSRIFAVLGAKFKGKSNKAKAIKSRKRKIHNAINYAQRKYSCNCNDNPFIVELLFHLGQFKENKPARINNLMLQGYRGINITYFNNRTHESQALDKMYQQRNYKSSNYWHHFENSARWKECPEFCLTTNNNT